MKFTATITPDEDGWFVAQCMEIDVVSQGKSHDEALANLQEAVELYVESFPDQVPEVEFATFDIAL